MIKLSYATFDSFSELLAQRTKSFGKQKQYGEDLVFTNSSKVESSRERGRGQSSYRGRGCGRSQGRGNNSIFQQGSNYYRSCQLERTPNHNDKFGTGRDMSQFTCRQCNSVGHFPADCRTSNNKLSKFKQLSNSTYYANANN